MKTRKSIAISEEEGTCVKKITIWKNVIIISFSFMLLFTSYNSVENLQSSVNKKLGLLSLWAVYICFIASSILLPSLIIRILTVKWTLCLSILCYSSYIAAQFYPKYYTLIPTAMLVGLAGGPLWTAVSVYLSQAGEKYANEFDEKSEFSTTKFFGCFFSIFNFSMIWGNLTSSIVFSVGAEKVNRTDEFLKMCGADYSSEFAVNLSLTNNETINGSEEDQLGRMANLSYILLAVSLLSAAIVAIFLDSLSKMGIDERSASEESTKVDIYATCFHLKNKKQILLLPLTIFCGLVSSFVFGDLTAGFVSCVFGVHLVGYFGVCMGATDILCSFIVGRLVKKVGQISIIIFGLILTSVILILLLLWKPDSSYTSLYVLLAIAAMLGITDGISLTMMSAMYSSTFPDSKKPAFSNYHVWRPFGFALSYLLSNFITIRVKIIIILLFLITGKIGYICVVWIRKKESSSNTSRKDKTEIS